jgi:hypothetical protein
MNVRQMTATKGLVSAPRSSIHGLETQMLNNIHAVATRIAMTYLTGSGT